MSSDSTPKVKSFGELLQSLQPLDQASYPIDGVFPSDAVRPRSVPELGDVVRAASAERKPLAPWGGGSQMGLGNVPADYALAVDLTEINEVLRYEPDDMTMSVQAGCRLAELNRMLGDNQQVLPIDAFDPELATIGGLSAIGASGPRRFGYGPLRDLIIGMTVLMTDGSIATAGGQVVKNVTGYDMMRLHHGALGSLGIILSLNLKVIPKPQSERTVIGGYTSLDAANRAAIAIVESQLGVTACVVVNAASAKEVDVFSNDSWLLAVRCEAPPSAVERQSERVAEEIREGSSDLQIEQDSERSTRLWQAFSWALDMRQGSPFFNIRVGTRATEMARVTESLSTLHRDFPELALLTLDYGSSLLYARIPRDSLSDEELFKVCESVTDLGEHVTLLTGTASFKQSIDVFGRTPAGFSVVESLKRTFDPDAILNRGRFLGHV